MDKDRMARALLSGLWLAICTPCNASARVLEHPDRQQAENGESGQNMGSFIDTDGTRLIVGVPDFADETAYVFRRSGQRWAFEARLDKPAFATRPSFGQAVAIDGDRAVVGGGLDEIFSYRRINGTWIADPAPVSLTGCTGTCGAVGPDTLDLTGNLLLVGAPGNAGAGSRGAVHVLLDSGNGFVQVQRLIDRDTTAGDRFGLSLDRSDTQVVIGGANLVTFYTVSGNSLVRDDQLITGSGSFGARVRVSEGVAAIGSPELSGSLTQQGRITLYVRNSNGWSELQQIQGTAQGQRLGRAFDLDGPLLAIQRGSQQSILHRSNSSGQYSVLSTSAQTGSQLLLHGTTLYAGNVGLDLGSNLDQGGVAVLDLNVSPPALLDTVFVADGPGRDRYGQALVLDAQHVYVGAPGRDFGAGQIFRYTRANLDAPPVRWIAPVGAIGFGHALAEGGPLVSGAPDSVHNSIDSGAVYVLDKATGAVLQTVLPNDPVPGLKFGRSVAVFEDALLVGAHESAYLFQFQNGQWVQAARSSRPEALDFGASVALSRFDGVIGAPDTPTLGGTPAVGACFVFQREVPTSLVQVLAPLPDRIAQARFCSTVTLAAGALPSEPRLLMASLTAQDPVVGSTVRDEVLTYSRDITGEFDVRGRVQNDPLRTVPLTRGVAANSQFLVYPAAGGVRVAERVSDSYTAPRTLTLDPAPHASFAPVLTLFNSVAAGGAPDTPADNGRITGVVHVVDLLQPVADAVFAHGFE